MSFYDDIADVAEELLAEFGQAAVLGIVTQGDYVPATGAAVSTTTTSTVNAALFAFPQRFIDGTTILTGDQRVLVSPLTSTGAVTPAAKAGDTLTDAAGTEYRVVNSKSVAPAGAAVLWILQVRK